MSAEELTAAAAPRADGPARLWRAERADCRRTALAMIAALCQRRRARRPVARWRWPCSTARREGGTVQVSMEMLEQCISQKIPAVRQEGRGALQPDLRPAQIHAQLRPRRGGVLAGPHAGGRGGPAVRSPARGALCQRGRGPGGPAARWNWPWPRIRRATFIGMPECIGAPDAGGGIPVAGAQVQRAVHRL